MEKTITEIANFFSDYDKLEISLSERTIKVDFDVLQQQYYSKILGIKRQILSSYLGGTETFLIKLKGVLERIKRTYSRIDYGINFSFEGSTTVSYTISPDEVSKIVKIKVQYIDEVITYIDELVDLQNDPQAVNQNRKAKKSISAPIISLFCKYLNDSGVDAKGYDESREDYCARICNSHGIRYTDRVRQLFGQKHTPRTKKSLIEKLLPTLSFHGKDKLLAYIGQQ